MPTSHTLRLTVTGCLLIALLCLPSCTSNEDPNNELQTQRIGDIPLTGPDVSTEKTSHESSTVHGLSHHQTTTNKQDGVTSATSTSSVDHQSTDPTASKHNVVTIESSVSDVPKNASKTNLSTQSIGSEISISVITSTLLPVSIKEDSETQNRHVSTMAGDDSTFLADEPVVTATVNDELQASTENDAHKLLTTDANAHQTESQPNLVPRLLTSATESPSDSTVPPQMIALQVSPEIDVSVDTDDPMMLDQQSSPDDHPAVREEHTTAEKDAAALELATASQNEPELQTDNGAPQQSGSPSTTKNMEHSAQPFTAAIDLGTEEDKPLIDEETKIVLTSAQDALTTFPLPVIVPAESSETTSAPSADASTALPQAGVVAEDDLNVLAAHHTTVWSPDGGGTSTSDDTPLVEIAALHPLHGTTGSEMISSPIPDTEYLTVGPEELETTNIQAVDTAAEDSSITTDVPIVSSIDLSPFAGAVEDDNMTSSETAHPSTIEDMMQIVTTFSSPVEETIISPELFPEVTDPRLWGNGTTEDSNNVSTISMVLEDLTPTLEPNRTHKDSEDLTDEEHSNAVTVIFYVPDPKRTDIYWYEERNQAFRLFVAEVLNHHEARRWPELYKNNGSFIDRSSDWAKRRKRDTDVGIMPEDLVYINPAPLVENRYIYVVFFVKNSSTPDPFDVVVAQKIVHALNSSRLELEEKIRLNVTRISTGIIIVKYMAPFFERHALIFIVLLAVAAFCILLIIIGLLYIRCRNARGNWRRNDCSDEKALKKDMKGTNPASGDVNAGNNIENDEPQMTEKYGNGNHVISLGDDDGWVMPYDDLTPAQKPRYDFEDTKL